MRFDDNWQDLLRRVPEVPIPFDGNCTQALGVDLPIVAINLAHRTDKWDAVSSRMATIGLNKLIKMPAVEGAKLDLDALGPLLAQPANRVENAPRSHYSMTRPAVGCFLSHLATWRWMLASGLPQVLVFEDDATPADGFDPGRFGSFIESKSRDAGMVLLGRIIMNGMADMPGPTALPRIYYFNGTFAYLITPAACKAILPRLLPMNGHIDHQISRVLIELRNELPAYYAEPPFFEPDWSLRSDCYVPMDGEADADRELGALLTERRQLLLDDGRPLLAAFGA